MMLMTTNHMDKYRVEEIYVEQNHDNTKTTTEAKPVDITSNSFNYQKGLYACLLALFVSISFSAPAILIPQHNIFVHPKYWYEPIITVSLTMPCHWMVAMYFENKAHLKIDEATSPAACIRGYLSAALSNVIFYVSFHLLWTYGLGFNPPIPFNTNSVHLSCMPFVATVWFNFPKEARKNKLARKRIFAFLSYIAWHWFFAFQYVVLTIIFQKIQPSFQWILVVILPFQRELNIFCLYKLFQKFSEGDKIVMKSFTSIYINCGHSLFLVIAIGSIATDATVYMILVGEFLINMHSCNTIIRLHKTKVGLLSDVHELESQKEIEVQMLVLCEMMETLVPLVYLGTFLIAYYGPNATILGNIRNGYWQYTVVKDVDKLISSVIQMFFIDIGSLVIGSVILWKFCRINILLRCCKIMDSYWKIISAYAGMEAAKVKTPMDTFPFF